MIYYALGVTFLAAVAVWETFELKLIILTVGVLQGTILKRAATTAAQAGSLSLQRADVQ